MDEHEQWQHTHQPENCEAVELAAAEHVCEQQSNRRDQPTPTCSEHLHADAVPRALGDDAPDNDSAHYRCPGGDRAHADEFGVTVCLPAAMADNAGYIAANRIAYCWPPGLNLAERCQGWVVLLRLRVE